MERTFRVNNKIYKAVPFNFNTVCDLEDSGVPLQEMQKKPMSMLRAYFAICYKGDKDAAGDEINAHVLNGGDFNELYEVMGAEMNESDFFQALNKKSDEETQTSTEKAKK